MYSVLCVFFFFCWRRGRELFPEGGLVLADVGVVFRLADADDAGCLLADCHAIVNNA